MRRLTVRKPQQLQYFLVLEWQKKYFPRAQVYVSDAIKLAGVEGMGTLSELVSGMNSRDWCCWNSNYLPDAGIGFVGRTGGHFARIVRVHCWQQHLRGMVCILVLKNDSNDPVQDEYTIQLSGEVTRDGIVGTLTYPNEGGGYESGRVLVTGFDFPE